mgnify:CR=1 FL=1
MASITDILLRIALNGQLQEEIEEGAIERPSRSESRMLPRASGTPRFPDIPVARIGCGEVSLPVQKRQGTDVRKTDISGALLMVFGRRSGET